MKATFMNIPIYVTNTRVTSSWNNLNLTVEFSVFSICVQNVVGQQATFKYYYICGFDISESEFQISAVGLKRVVTKCATTTGQYDIFEIFKTIAFSSPELKPIWGILIYVVHECVTREHYKRTVALKGQVEQ